MRWRNLLETLTVWTKSTLTYCRVQKHRSRSRWCSGSSSQCQAAPSAGYCMSPTSASGSMQRRICSSSSGIPKTRRAAGSGLGLFCLIWGGRVVTVAALDFWYEAMRSVSVPITINGTSSASLRLRVASEGVSPRAASFQSASISDGGSQSPLLWLSMIELELRATGYCW